MPTLYAFLPLQAGGVVKHVLGCVLAKPMPRNCLDCIIAGKNHSEQKLSMLEGEGSLCTLYSASPCQDCCSHVVVGSMWRQYSVSEGSLLHSPLCFPLPGCGDFIGKIDAFAGPFSTKTKECFQIDDKDDAVRGALVLEQGELRWPAPPPAVRRLSF